LTFSDDGHFTNERQYWDVYPLVELWMDVGVINA
jgi:hypothetical protein